MNKGKIMKYVSPEYEQQLKDLAHTICPINEVVEINPLSIPRDEEYSFQYLVEDDNWGYDSEGNYHCPSLRAEHLDG
jgi:hypothetical protein